VPADDSRPDPDALLAQVRGTESRARRGRLKIFFGMCPGVGKTYAMLQAARKRHAEGMEVVAGIVETHGRAETSGLLEGLPVAPLIETEHRGARLAELDLDAILAWRPKLVLVDELAHTNVPGSRHPKRYQDVLELLEAGIDVLTTLNVQHVESRADTVREITGITVRETVPDSILDAADEIELIDLTPEQLRQRLAEGKVYLGDRAAAAAENFFRESHLTALREMALRLTAEHVDRRLRTLRPVQQSWRTGDRLLVAVSASPHSTQLLRWTRRYAAGLEAPWIAVAVELPQPLSETDAARLASNLALARQLGAEVILTSGVHVGQALLRVAQQHGVTQIILGKPDGSPWRWLISGRSPVAWLIQHSGNIDVQLVRTDDPSGAAVTPRRFAPVEWQQHGIALGIAVGVTVISLLTQQWIGYWSAALLYLLAVTLTATVLRRRPTLLLAAVSALAWNYLFIPPLFTFYISAPHDVMMFAMFFVVALVVGHLTTRLREREMVERRREERATALYQLTRALAASDSRDAAIRVAVTQVERVFGRKVAILLRDESGVFSGAAHPASSWLLPAKEEGVAAWAFQNRRPAGRTTDALPDSAGLHLPIAVADRVEGVLALELPAGHGLLPEQRELLDAFGAQLALVAEKGRVATAQQRAQVLAESEKLQKTLFDSVSHELKTPIAAITAALDHPEPQPQEIRRALDRLSRTVEHLLNASRLESGALQLNLEWCEPAEIIRDAIDRAGLSGQIAVEAPADLPTIRVDATLLAQALATLLGNATSHGASPEPPTLTVALEGNVLRFDVADRGPGLPHGDEERLFANFQRGPGVMPGGLGLGLSIARRLAELHRGTLTAENRPAGGARFTLRIPSGGEMKLPA
jgi:two-component system sensor histidine kinase KdpD